MESLNEGVSNQSPVCTQFHQALTLLLSRAFMLAIISANSTSDGIVHFRRVTMAAESTGFWRRVTGRGPGR
jgi:hypothetical protein